MTGSIDRPTFVGRSIELATVVDALEAAPGSLVLLSGEAGAGKTTLVERALAQTDRRQLTVRVPDEDGVSPWWPWRRQARALPAMSDALSTGAAQTPAGKESTDQVAIRAEDAAAARFRLHDAVAEALATQAAAEPMIVVLEDAHLLDAASAGLLGHLVTALDDESARGGGRRFPSGCLRSHLREVTGDRWCWSRPTGTRRRVPRVGDGCCRGCSAHHG